MTERSSPDTPDALLPCPFCGSHDLTLTVNEQRWKIVECDDCGSRGPCIDLDGDHYLHRWNSRGDVAARPRDTYCTPDGPANCNAWAVDARCPTCPVSRPHSPGIENS